MSYEVLARKLRPPTFDEVVGQPHVTKTLRNAIRSGRIPHAVLLCGPRGVGKTSIARILARSLNCDDGPTEKPCGTCPACVEIATSRSMDVQEIDAASHTGVDNVREIRDSVRFSAGGRKYRIFIIDEVHMLSGAAFNALLKTLEEPPTRSLFIFATTDPQKIPATVLSRVQRFDLKRLGAAELLSSLMQIAAAEEIDVPESVLRALVREGDGSFRDVLTLLDRLVSGLGKHITEEEAALVLDLIDRRVIRAIIDPILTQDAQSALLALEQALDKGAEPTKLATDLLGELRDLLVARIVTDPGALIDAPADEVAALVERAAPVTPDTLQRLFRVLLTRAQDLPLAPRPRHALEVAIVRMATLPEAEPIAQLIARIDALERGGTTGPGRGGGAGGGDAAGAPRAGAAGAGRSPRMRAAPDEPTRGDDSKRAGARAPRTQPVGTDRPIPTAPPPSAAPPSSPARPVPATPRRSGEPADAPVPSLSAEPRLREPRVDRDAILEAQRAMKAEAKSHPAVKLVIETLDAEIRDIRLPRTP